MVKASEGWENNPLVGWSFRNNISAVQKQTDFHGERRVAARLSLLCKVIGEVDVVFQKSCDSSHKDQAPGDSAGIMNVVPWS